MLSVQRKILLFCDLLMAFILGFFDDLLMELAESGVGCHSSSITLVSSTPCCYSCSTCSIIVESYLSGNSCDHRFM